MVVRKRSRHGRCRIAEAIAVLALTCAGAGCQPPEAHSIPDDGSGVRGGKVEEGQGRFQGPANKSAPAPAGRAGAVAPDESIKSR